MIRTGARGKNAELTAGSQGEAFYIEGSRAFSEENTRHVDQGRRYGSAWGAIESPVNGCVELP